MNARPAIAFALLLTFPHATLAQTPAAESKRLDLTTIKNVHSEPESKPFSLPLPKSLRLAVQQAAATSQSCVESEARGRTDADNRKFNHGWFWAGAGMGAFLGIFGIGAAPLSASIVKPKPKTTPAGVDQACYAQGFGSKGRHENVLTALWGSFLGIGIFFLAWGISGAYGG
jgi:hypothetical protein